MDVSGVQTARMTSVRWKIFLLLLLLVSINYIDRAALSVAMPAIAAEFDLSPERQGLILSSFFWTYLFMQVPSGMLADRLKPRALIAWATIGWGAFQALGALCTGWFALLLTRLGLGITEAPIYPGGGKLNALWLTQNEKTRGASIVDAGSALGSGVGAVVVATLMTWFGSWRAAFVVAGVGTILCGIWAWWYIRNTPREHPSISQAEIDYIERAHAEEDAREPKTAAGGSMLRFFGFRSVWGMCASHTCTNLIFFGLMTWLPTYLYKAHGFDLKSLGGATFIIFFAGFVGEVIAGSLADKWKAAGGSSNLVYRSMMMIGAFAVAASMLGVANVRAPFAVVGLLCVALFFLRWCGGCNWATPAMLATRARTGTLNGIMNFVGNIAGIFVPIFIGYIVQTTGSYFLALMFFVAVAVFQMIVVLAIDYQKKLPV
ncbi:MULTISPECIES: MFS transporter [unclassified Caballeronia]|uniref:MFS transporter n=1 Tax=unclassified Caballeronia TaxID=2646786 RepID=UPI0028609B17|nr:MULTISPECIES: MFS transporter [unclassified Caballeronia]MDR5814185.1 MFS transporter [Caballeronia sp. LZ033]MDR5825655.1 MFS transporter [Caballeronia sp. LZ043]MDR5835817.1 MFS transporter [Caballeronia sp. LZ034LL]MDR5878732.1 MFS transporter [Caballeronia sp. LZ032]